MFSPGIRWLLVALSLAFGIRELLEGRWHGGMFIGAGLLLGYGHFRYGSVRAAFVALRRGKLQRAAKLLHRTPTRWLSGQSRAYYEWVSAALAEAHGDVPKARDHLSAAVELPLRTDRDRVLALGTLAALHEKMGETAAADQRLNEAEELGPDEAVSRLLQQIRNKLPRSPR